MEENKIIEEKKKEKGKYSSFIYSLPFKTGAAISSFVILIFGLICVLLFMMLWESGVYSMADDEIRGFLAGDAADLYRSSLFVLKIAINIRHIIFPVGVILGILYLIDITFIFAAVGHKRGSEEITKFSTADWPFDITCLLYLFVFGIGVNILPRGVYGDNFWIFLNGTIYALIFSAILYFAFLSFCLNFIVNLKAKTLFSNMLIIRIFKFIFGSLGKAIENADVTKKAFLYFGTIVGAELGILFVLSSLENDGTSSLFFLLFLLNIFIFIVIYKVMTGVKDIETAEKNIIAGNLDYKLNTANYKGDLKIMAAGLNEIGSGLENAVNERMKSERFKTELITNVSHDIKTPLTSIINYTDLLKKENFETDPVKGYIEVLDRQSERLRKLINDLLEASKASSGNVKMELTRVDAGLMLEQVCGEYQDKFEKAGLTGIVTKPEETVFIKADINHLFRVFDNILGNALKYAQPDTRVYIDLMKNGRGVTIAFKNISKEKLNITGEELMERFVRGDRSRNTEGSGLGLSIARSLINLMGGEMDIVVDGDLFKVEVRFAE